MQSFEDQKTHECMHQECCGVEFLHKIDFQFFSIHRITDWFRLFLYQVLLTFWTFSPTFLTSDGIVSLRIEGIVARYEGGPTCSCVCLNFEISFIRATYSVPEDPAPPPMVYTGRGLMFPI